ncbi:hypothetical protein INT47_006690 [Mucor saturninus]|uniref:Uncharacterized protein n=1 Tax=Mucor saturninus TaxID=64648 RepID=A0A8H7QRW5_9FUNG|nr:hypothetical protein INT47_006690 [Mucor saturninus]
MLSKSSRFSLLLVSTIVLLSLTVTNVDCQPLDCVNKNGAIGSDSVGGDYCVSSLDGLDVDLGEETLDNPDAV